jgi:hypothetical protein
VNTKGGMQTLPLDYTRCSSDSCILRAKCLRWTDTAHKVFPWALSWTDFTEACEASPDSNHFILDERKNETND